ncbi:GntR family transcriptional regulator [Agrobacterium tumefaciens]|nr:GntR family transcriptional regulator [Agrobacterium salinitolerans]TRB03194.1 GntR family transcriptional regulator [Agrobacterium tumefaciens]TRB16575.1 GntR family transcriptional regulator [Agrobacterium tumefaciens]BAB16151.1 riorf32 [Rhizobium rhizogenes]
MRSVKLNSENTGAGTKDLALQIERDINIGRVSPGSWLKQIDLEKTYGVSRLSVRQALERLAERGHVELFPNRGYRVKEFDLQRFNNIINIRAVLEVAAVEMVVGTIDAKSLTELRSLADQFKAAVTTGTSADQETANRAFHQELLRTCSNRDIVELIFDLRDRIPVAVQREKNNAPMLHRSAEEHFEMITLLEKGDRSGLAALVRRHALGSLLPHGS